MSFQIWFALFAVQSLSSAFEVYRDEIPNGNNIPHPCKENYRWPGVGHENPRGGGPRNLFGIAFHKAGLKWTKELCNEDSDGDGKKNGEELGDPSCTWQKGLLPSKTTDITHPGVCDPYSSEKCNKTNSFLNCGLDSFETCKAIKKPDVKMLNLTFPLTKVPPTQTNYFCMTFDLPKDRDYHIVANEPIIDNGKILHHMLLFGCDSPDDLYLPTPQPCGMNSEICNSIISGWTVGQSGNCFANNTGFRFGKTGFQRVRYEVHYNNPNNVATYVDASGIRLYYQPAKPETQDLATFSTGQMLLEIPPGKKEVPHLGVCPSECLQMLLKEPIYVVSVNNHMHYMGKSAKIVVFRNGTEFKTISNDEVYNYDSPVEHWHNPPFQILPTDMIQTHCVYSSVSSSRYVFFGESTSDEMCFGFLTVYPKSALRAQSCVSYGHSSTCDIFINKKYDSCNWTNFTNFTSNVKMYDDFARSCSLYSFCRPECQELLKQYENHPCLNGDAHKWVIRQLKKTKEGLDFLARVQSCNKKCDQAEGETDDGNNTAASIVPQQQIIALVLLAMVYRMIKGE